MENNDDIYNWESSQPTTIEELKQWYAARHLPPEEVTRFFIGIVLLLQCFKSSIPNGYYLYEGLNYYHQGVEWFLYDELRKDWRKTGKIDAINKDNASKYRITNFKGKQFEDTQWYNPNTNDDRDYDWDTGSDSWDSGDTDWDSDW